MTYNFVTDAGTTTINYGDTNITYTIVEGDTTTINNYYYYVEAPASTPSPVVSCDHDYTSTITREPSCTVAGITTYTCSKCGHTYTQPIDALGHDWLKTDTVATTYSLPDGTSCPTCGGTAFTYTLDESTKTYTCTCSDTACAATWTVAADVSEGYNLYTCSRCGEQYKDFDGTGPPDDSTGIFAAIGDFIGNCVDWILEKLRQLVDAFSSITDTFNEYVEQVKESGGGVSTFLTSAVAQIPSELMTVFWFSLVAFVIVLVFKKFLS